MSDPSDAPVEQATAAPGEKRRRASVAGVAGKKIAEAIGLPTERLHRLEITIAVGEVAQVTAHYHGTDDLEVVAEALGAGDLVETTTLTSPIRTYRRIEK